MSNKKQIYKPKPISGFPEWLPEVRRVEQQWLDHIRRIFERYGFCSIETPAVEELDVITAKGGDADKEIYVLERLQADPDDKKDARLALHFDQTVPLARYVAMNFNELVFPFKRYQMQKVWRGERPQSGRFREFMQCDIDVINVDNLPMHFDAEIPSVIWEVLSTLPGMEGESIKLRISNRKILIGLLEALGIQNIVEITRIIDKMEKIGETAVRKLLDEHGVSADNAEKILSLASLKTGSGERVLEFVKSIKIDAAIADAPEAGGVSRMIEGAEELAFVLNHLKHLPIGAAEADLSIVRGLDYYTGTVYETVFTDDPSYGSICSGGRYDDLAGGYINKYLPGVGISIGFSRLFDRLRQKQKLETGRISPADVLVVLPAEERRPLTNETAQMLRSRGINVEAYHAPQKIGKQISYAEKKGIPFVWFPPFEDGGVHEVKNMQTGDQKAGDPASWCPDE